MATENHWQVVPFDEFELPSAPARTIMQKGLDKFKRIVGITKSEQNDSQQDDAPHYREFDRAPAVAALESSFGDWADDDNATSVRWLISPPYSGAGQCARDWAKQRQWTLPEPPPAENLSQDSLAAWQGPKKGQPWVLTTLSAYWLRDTQRMTFLRTLLAALMRGDFGKGLVVCDSWTFAFIQRAWTFEIPHSYCFAAATPELLQQVGIEARTKQARELLAETRGNLGVTMAIWALQQQENPTRPELPRDCNDFTAFILHSLLLHHGLSEQQLISVLPLIPAAQRNVQLANLAAHHIIEPKNNQWRVAVTAYPLVRDMLAGRGFWLDQF
ncbi:hypothetical protein CWE22_11055 [Pseudidiomarina aestuarii]|uniref:Uncharacterized protein n=1 Tax=Pseudidiomarina aestuarii TaxID=624146 RepID=A0A7Z6ZRR3_9GAMM|nr:hypothetical protein [Pseudidiomarina aestuarii]RUO38958.1 hypothetical protein CWE22_11055 [Pseudidiomarina aestuarii]